MPSMSHAGPVGIAGALLAAGFFLLGYTNHSIYLIAAVFIAYGVWLVVRAFLHPAKPPVDLNWMGDIVPETLSLHNGQDPYLPLLMAVKGRVYDVSKGRDFYGPGGAYSAFAGRAVDRALAKMSLNEEDCTANVDDCTSKELGILQEWADKLDKKYKVVGRLVEPKKLTLEELRQYDGSDEKLPMLLAIRGRVFDVSRGSQYYGPNGAYPFAGYEVARALATMSTNEADFTDCLDDLTQYDRDQLRNWEELFRSKYPLVGVVVPSEGR